MSQVTVKKWGNSPSVRLPVAIMQAAALHMNDTLEIFVEDGRIILEPVREDCSLSVLLSGISDDNLHDEVDFGAPVGKESL